MSRLAELIQELCPDGVEILSLSEVAHYAKSRIDASEVNEDTYVGVGNLLQNKQGKTVASSVPTSGAVIAFNCGDILIGNIRPYLKKIWLADCDGGTNGDVLTVQINELEKLMPKFLYYVLSSDQFFLYDMQNSKGAKMPRGSKEAVMKYSVPVPPLEVQSEIVRILDNFTELTAELTAELTTELAARQKQYSYYRNHLLSFNSEIPFVKLGDFCDLLTGFPFDSSQFVNQGICLMRGMNIKRGILEFNDDIDRYWENSNGLERFLLEDGDIVISMDGSLVGKSYGMVRQDNLPLLLVQRVTRIRTEKANIRYVYHYIASGSFTCYVEKKKTGGAIPHISLKDIANFSIPLPELDVQNRLVDILDNFDAICSDLNIGLPAEIEARTKQYEYYRDKLLTFKEK